MTRLSLVGFQTIYGELVSLESNNDVMGLAMFILGRLLWNPDIAAEFRHSKVPHLYRDGNLKLTVFSISTVFYSQLFPQEMFSNLYSKVTHITHLM